MALTAARQWTVAAQRAPTGELKIQPLYSVLRILAFLLSKTCIRLADSHFGWQFGDCYNPVRKLEIKYVVLQIYIGMELQIY